MRVGGQHHAPAALPPGKTRCPLYRRLGGPQGWSGRVRKISPPTGIRSWTVQPVASRYTDWAKNSNLITTTVMTPSIIINQEMSNKRWVDYRGNIMLNPTHDGSRFLYLQDGRFWITYSVKWLAMCWRLDLDWWQEKWFPSSPHGQTDLSPVGIVGILSCRRVKPTNELPLS